MRKLIASLLLAAALACAQGPTMPSSGYSALNTYLNGLVSGLSGAGAPTSVACTAGANTYFDTTNLDYYGCTVTGNPGTWMLLTASRTFTVGTGGVTVNTLVQTDSSNPSKVVATTTGAYGIALATVSATGTVKVARYGTYPCVTDTGGATAGDLVIIGTGSAIDCKDSGQTSSSAISIGTRIVGVFLTTATAGNTALVDLTPAHFGTLEPRQYGGAFGSPGGTALSTGQVVYAVVSQSCAISGYNILVDAGTATVKFWKIATGTALPTVANVINTSGLAISTGTALHSSTTSDFTTTTVTANDIVALTNTASSGAGWIYATFTCQ